MTSIAPSSNRPFAAPPPRPLAARLLVINPNTSAVVTTLLQRQVSQQMAQWDTPGAAPACVDAVCARFGPAYIASEVAYAIASHACLDAWAAAAQQHANNGQPATWNGVLIGCFGDPGLLALRELAPVPVTGLAEGAFAIAARHGRFGIVTGGERWKPMLQRLAQALHYEDALAAITTVQLTGAQLMADRTAALRILQQACEQLMRSERVEAIVIGGAALAGMAADLQAHIPIPLIDSVHAGTNYLREQILATQASHHTEARPDHEHTAPVQWSGLSAELGARLSHRA